MRKKSLPPNLHQAFEQWREGYGVIHHKDNVVNRVKGYLAHANEQQRARCLDLLISADRLCSAGMWLTSLMTYAKNVYLDGRRNRVYPSRC